MFIPLLDPRLCRSRQDRLRSLLEEQELDAAIISHRHYVHALTGYWHQQPLTPVAVLVRSTGSTTLFAPEGPVEASAADDLVPYVAQRLATIVESPLETMAAEVGPLLQGLRRIGQVAPFLLSGVDAEWVDITRAYQYLRRAKDSDEIRLLRFAVRVTESTYDDARRLLPSYPTEIELHAAMHQTALREVGEPLSGWGNDFQSGSPGGLPRHRHVEPGELAVYDIGVGVRCYRSDLCRSFAVDEHPTESQLDAHARILEAIDFIEDALKPGVRCVELFGEIKAMLDGWNDYSFPHHLGHGIGLDAHEVPRLNPEWDDRLEVGDVIAVEPALYGEDLRAGIRLEHNYLITESGAERLSSFPLDL